MKKINLYPNIKRIYFAFLLLFLLTPSVGYSLSFPSIGLDAVNSGGGDWFLHTYINVEADFPDNLQVSYSIDGNQFDLTPMSIWSGIFYYYDSIISDGSGSPGTLGGIPTAYNNKEISWYAQNSSESIYATTTISSIRYIELPTIDSIGGDLLNPTITWSSPNQNLDHYLVRIFDETHNYLLGQWDAGLNTSFTITDFALEQDRNYIFRVEARDTDFLQATGDVESIYIMSRAKTEATYSTAPVPEPATMLLLGTGLLGLAGVRRRIKS